MFVVFTERFDVEVAAARSANRLKRTAERNDCSFAEELIMARFHFADRALSQSNQKGSTINCTSSREKALDCDVAFIVFVYVVLFIGPCSLPGVHLE